MGLRWNCNEKALPQEWEYSLAGPSGVWLLPVSRGVPGGWARLIQVALNVTFWQLGVGAASVGFVLSLAVLPVRSLQNLRAAPGSLARQERRLIFNLKAAPGSLSFP